MPSRRRLLLSLLLVLSLCLTSLGLGLAAFPAAAQEISGCADCESDCETPTAACAVACFALSLPMLPPAAAPLAPHGQSDAAIAAMPAELHGRVRTPEPDPPRA